MIQTRPTLRIAGQIAPNPIATPTAALTQTLAAVVNPLTSRASVSLRIAPPPMNPIPVTMP
jgi:hypothetical protein